MLSEQVNESGLIIFIIYQGAEGSFGILGPMSDTGGLIEKAGWALGLGSVCSAMIP